MSVPLIHSRILIAVRDFQNKHCGRKAVTRIELGYEEYKDLCMVASQYLKIEAQYGEEQNKDVVVTEFCGMLVVEKPTAQWLSVE